MTVIITNEQDKIEIPADWEEKINRVAAICLKALIKSSLAIIMLTQIEPITVGITDGTVSKNIKAVLTKSLSAIGSKNLPRLVTILYFLAIYPSKKSDTARRINNPNATKFEYGKLINPTAKNTGNNIILENVILFGKFIIFLLLNRNQVIL